jgi:carboxymethylenebutenolidase
MCDDDIHVGLVTDPTLSRRAFGLTLAAAAGGAGAARAQAQVVEKDVQVKTPDGVSDAVLFHPPGRSKHPAVLVWTDIMGLRPAFRQMGRRLASQGYVVLVPNPFYRSKRAPVLEGDIDFSNPATRQLLGGYRQAMSGGGGPEADAKAYLAFLDAQPQTDRRRKAGVQGYCMGGPLSFRTAAAAKERIGAVASFHGGGLVTDDPTSPHRVVVGSKAEFLVAHARNDDAKDPTIKDKLRQALTAAGIPNTVEVYAADHGWCVPGSQVYDAAEAERAWSALSDLYKRRLV